MYAIYTAQSWIWKTMSITANQKFKHVYILSVFSLRTKYLLKIFFKSHKLQQCLAVWRKMPVSILCTANKPTNRFCGFIHIKGVSLQMCIDLQLLYFNIHCQVTFGCNARCIGYNEISSSFHLVYGKFGFRHFLVIYFLTAN